MRMLIGLSLSLVIIAPAWATGTATTASKVFAAVSPSVVVVEAFDAKGHAVALGSGVVIAKGVVVSNCHVFEEAGTQTASVFYRKKRLPAELRYGDPSHDLCSFTVKGLTAPPAKMGATAALQVGENAYAIGAPEGLDLTLSTGIVSSLRKIPGGVVIQTTAPISPGSSGGGLFDSQDRLIGITSYYEKEGQQLNFALPVEWIKALPQRGKTLKELANRQSLKKPRTARDILGPPPGKPKARANFQKGVKAEYSGDYATAFSIFKPLAEHGNADAQSQLGWMYGTGQGVRQDYPKAVYWYRKAAAQGNADAQYNLGLMYTRGNGVPQDDAKALYWYRKAAAQGSAEAQNNIGAMYAIGQGVPQNYAKAAYWDRKAAVQGNTDAQVALGSKYYFGRGVPQDYDKAFYWFRKSAIQGDPVGQTLLGRMYANGQSVPRDYAKAAYWYGKAAEQGNPSAQYGIALLYGNGEGVPQDFVRATMWVILAKAGGDKQASKLLSSIEQNMSSWQISEAQRLANQWWEAHHKQQ